MSFLADCNGCSKIQVQFKADGITFMSIISASSRANEVLADSVEFEILQNLSKNPISILRQWNKHIFLLIWMYYSVINSNFLFLMQTNGQTSNFEVFTQKNNEIIYSLRKMIEILQSNWTCYKLYIFSLDNPTTFSKFKFSPFDYHIYNLFIP